MSTLIGFLSNLRRPKLLVEAARHGLTEYDRKRDLQRLTGRNPNANSRAVIEALIAQEEQFEEIRKSGEVTYSVARHVELLVVLMAECVRAPRPIQNS